MHILLQRGRPSRDLTLLQRGIDRLFDEMLSPLGQTERFGDDELPGSVDVNKLEAQYEDGVLRISLPKSETSKARVVPIGERKKTARHIVM